MTYLELVNSLRNRFNEVELTSTNFDSVVGFDQFCKDTINYAYSDILLAEMEWPFLHVKSTLQTVPGVQFYNVSTGNSDIIKELDWDSFFIAPNTVVLQITNEAKTIPTSAIVAPTNLITWNSDLGVVYSATSIAFVPVDRDPQVGQYTIKNGSYYFHTTDIGAAILLTYRTAAASVVNVTNARFLQYMDYDVWRQTRLAIDFNDYAKESYSLPNWVFKTQQQGEIGLSPIPNRIYIVDFECWLDTADLILPTDVPLLPTRFHQVILDGAQKYCYEFREDPQLAASADKRFNAGVTRMRTELINRESSMNAGMQWRKRGFYNTLSTA